MSQKTDIIIEMISDGNTTDFLALWIDLSIFEKNEISNFLKKIPIDQLSPFIDRTRLLNEHVANEIIEMAEFNSDTILETNGDMPQETQEFESDSRSISKILGKMDINSLNAQYKAKILGEFRKALMAEGIKDKTTIRNLLVAHLEGMTYHDS